MANALRFFYADEEGAVTVDWVVLTAAIVGISVALVLTISAGATNKTTGIAQVISSQTVDGTPD